MSIKKLARSQADDARKQRETRRTELPARLEAIDRAEAAHPANAAKVATWAKDHAGIVVAGRAAGMAVGVCEWAEHVRDDHERIDDDLSSIDRNEGAYRKHQGRQVGKLRAAAKELEKLHQQGVVTAQELRSFTRSIDKVCGRLTLPIEGTQTEPTGRETIETKLGTILMSLMLAVGYGHGYQYSAKRAAEVIVGIAILYGFRLDEQQLRNTASQLRKKTKKK